MTVSSLRLSYVNKGRLGPASHHPEGVGVGGSGSVAAAIVVVAGVAAVCSGHPQRAMLRVPGTGWLRPTGAAPPLGGIDRRPKGAAMPLLDLFWAMLWFFLFFAWIWLMVMVLTDLFRSEMSGWGKALWAVFIIVLPLVGVFLYLIVHGGRMQERSTRYAAAMEQRQRDYIKTVANSPSTADEISKLAELHERGVINDSEFNAKKAALLR
jgi:Short C-terminal domain/Phospholipase_D-nuclease N-terminal